MGGRELEAMCCVAGRGPGTVVGVRLGVGNVSYFMNDFLTGKEADSAGSLPWAGVWGLLFRS